MILNRPNIYIAAPLFTPTERQWNKHIRDGLSDFADVYLPQEDGALLVDLVAEGLSVEAAKATIFKRDVVAIERCNLLVLVMDGRIVDEGACFELGYAYSRGKVCVGLKTDVRSLLPIGDNPMIECALRKIFRNVDEMFDWIKSGAWKKSS
jgi:nucleoside 2-deoxyribosyltransferase